MGGNSCSAGGTTVGSPGGWHRGAALITMPVEDESGAEGRMRAAMRRRVRRFAVGPIAAGALVLVGSFAGALWALDVFFPTGARRPPLAAMPPLAPATRTSTITAPVAITLGAIRDQIEQHAPRELSGTRDNPLGQLLGKADIGWSMTRTPFTVAGRSEGLVISTALNGTLRVTGQVAEQAGSVGSALGNLIGGDAGRRLQNIAGKTLDQRADVRGNVTVTARPILDNNWRIDPNLGAQVAVGDSALSIAGVKLSVSNEVKPLLDRTVNEQTAALAARIRNDPALELAARREWAKMCRSISLKGVGADAADLWLEVRPIRAFAAQPRIDENAVTLTLGVEAQTRVSSGETKPDCPFPAELKIVQQLEHGRVALGVPIEMPFAEVSRLLDARLKGRDFPAGGGGAVAITVLGASLAPSGDRLLISLRVKAHEQRTFFGFGGEATVYVWGRPVLDRERQILRLEDVALDVQSEAAFGLLGATARAAMPYLQAALADNAVIDLKPFAASAQQSIGAVLAEFRQAEPGVQVDAAITGLRLVDLAYDANTLRIVAEAEGSAQATVTALPKP
jgi:Domain of unknown function (DUF4403)